MSSDRVDYDILFDLGMIDRPPPNNARHWIYGKGDNCDHVVELPINESRLWCPTCTQEGVTSQLRKIFLPPRIEPVWQEFFCEATGRVESDRKKMEQYGRDHAKWIGEETGIKQDFIRTDPSELRREAERTSNRQLSNIERGDQMAEALVSTHDKAVKEGRKESKGRFTF